MDSRWGWPRNDDSRVRVRAGGAAATLACRDSPFEADPSPPAPRPPSPSEGARYEMRLRIGEGGMGVVRGCVDRRIGREIAMKTARPGARARFLREARLQGQLEHPAIVPVYDVGYDGSGAPYFTMKRVRGSTLEHIVRALNQGDERVRELFPRRKLLRAFGSVCLAVHFAHARGVVHRDLKPANVMLGEFGEVYVLDWGIAHISKRGGSSPLDFDDESVAGGPAVGTPGYSAPEQLRGEAVDERADVYALGTILFELLTLQPLHRDDGLPELMASVQREPETRFSVRAPARELPAELEAVCRRATHLDRARRYASARDLADAIWAFLDAEGDAGRRRTIREQAERRARRPSRGVLAVAALASVVALLVCGLLLAAPHLAAFAALIGALGTAGGAGAWALLVTGPSR